MRQINRPKPIEGLILNPTTSPILQDKFNPALQAEG